MGLFAFMAKTYIIHLPHFLDEKGRLSLNLPGPARKFALGIGRFVSYATNFDGEDNEMPQCLAAIKRKRCRGQVISGINLSVGDNIEWHCTSCGTCGVVSGWQGSLWDLSERGALQ